jgi:hypothetical protein
LEIIFCWYLALGPQQSFWGNICTGRFAICKAAVWGWQDWSYCPSWSSPPWHHVSPFNSHGWPLQDYCITVVPWPVSNKLTNIYWLISYHIEYTTLCAWNTNWTRSRQGALGLPVPTVYQTWKVEAHSKVWPLPTVKNTQNGQYVHPNMSCMDLIHCAMGTMHTIVIGGHT